MLSSKAGKKLTNSISDYVLFDLETTGISWKKDEVVEISAIKVQAGEVIEEFSHLVNPCMPIPFYASEVNGITDDMVAKCPTFDVILEEFLEFAGDAVVVGHNIQCFDMKFLQKSAQNYYGKLIGNDYIDTLQLARIYLPEMHHHTLIDLAEHYGISSAGAHRALNDCRMNQKVFECLKKEMENPSAVAKAVKKCPKCGNLMQRKSGRYGAFWGCMSYPDCRYTENIGTMKLYME